MPQSVNIPFYKGGGESGTRSLRTQYRYCLVECGCITKHPARRAENRSGGRAKRRERGINFVRCMIPSRPVTPSKSRLVMFTTTPWVSSFSRRASDVHSPNPNAASLSISYATHAAHPGEIRNPSDSPRTTAQGRRCRDAVFSSCSTRIT